MRFRRLACLSVDTIGVDDDSVDIIVRLPRVTKSQRFVQMSRHPIAALRAEPDARGSRTHHLLRSEGDRRPADSLPLMTGILEKQQKTISHAFDVRQTLADPGPGDLFQEEGPGTSGLFIWSCFLHIKPIYLDTVAGLFFWTVDEPLAATARLS